MEEEEEGRPREPEDLKTVRGCPPSSFTSPWFSWPSCWLGFLGNPSSYPNPSRHPYFEAWNKIAIIETAEIYLIVTASKNSWA